MKLLIDIPENTYRQIQALARNGYFEHDICGNSMRRIANGKSLDMVLDEIRTEIKSCLKALDEIEKSGFNIYLPNEMSGRRLTYEQCMSFIDKYKAESEEA